MKTWLCTRKLRFALCLLIGSVAASADAQEIAHSFDQLGGLIRSGDSVSVTDNSGRQVTGKLTSLSAASLSLEIEGRRQEWSASDIATIHQRRRDSFVNGALWGLVGGAAFAATLSVLMWEASDGPGDAIGFVASYAGLGTAIGVGVDALVAGNRTIYQRPTRAARQYSIAPMLTPTRRGVAMTVGF